MKIEIFFRNVYGTQLIYPSCDTAKILAAFAGCRVFSPTQIQQLRSAGVQVDQVPDPRARLEDTQPVPALRADGMAADPFGPQSDKRGRS